MKGFIKGFDDDEASKDEQLHSDKMRRRPRRRSKLVDDFELLRKKKSTAKKHQHEVDEARGKVYETFRELNINRKLMTARDQPARRVRERHPRSGAGPRTITPSASARAATTC